MVKAALSFGRDFAFALAAGSVAGDRTERVAARQPGGNSDGADNQGRIRNTKISGTGSQAT